MGTYIINGSQKIATADTEGMCEVHPLMSWQERLAQMQHKRQIERAVEEQNRRSLEQLSQRSMENFLWDQELVRGKKRNL